MGFDFGTGMLGMLMALEETIYLEMIEAGSAEVPNSELNPVLVPPQRSTPRRVLVFDRTRSVASAKPAVPAVTTGVG